MANPKQNFFDRNFKTLKLRFPHIAGKLNNFKAIDVKTAATPDGGYCYIVPAPDGKLKPVSNPQDPVESCKRIIAGNEQRLFADQSPVVLIGLNPGYLLDTLFANFIKPPGPFRRIYVIVTSAERLAGWLNSADRTALLEKDEIEFFFSDEVEHIVQLCEKDEQRLYSFVPLTSFVPGPETDALLEPLKELCMKRDDETLRRQKESQEYYDTISDSELLRIITGKAGRKPRLLIPACSESTVTQFSARDTCAAFEDAGWETQLLRLERGLSVWRMAKAVNSFKPDILIFIGHLRTETGPVKVYPDNLLFISWIQDTLPWINSSVAAAEWKKHALTKEPGKKGRERKRDFIAGYIDQILPFGYPAERCLPLGMIVNNRIFHPRKLSDSDIRKYSCRICFASNQSREPEKIVDEILFPRLSPYGFSSRILHEIRLLLEEEYRLGNSFVTYEELKFQLFRIPGFHDIYRKLENDKKNRTLEAVFWELNDSIYRHTVLEWCIGLGLNLRLYGRGWEQNPRFAHYAAGEIRHGEELSKAYQAAACCLHLNCLEGTHQRFTEIKSAGGRPLSRFRNSIHHKALSADLSGVFRKILKHFHSGNALCDKFSEAEKRTLSDFILSETFSDSPAFSNQKDFSTYLYSRLRINRHWLNKDECLYFDSKKGLEKIIREEIQTASKISQAPSEDLNIVSSLIEFLTDSLSEKASSEERFSKAVSELFGVGFEPLFGFVSQLGEKHPDREKILESFGRTYASTDLMRLRIASTLAGTGRQEDASKAWDFLHNTDFSKISLRDTGAFISAMDNFGPELVYRTMPRILERLGKVTDCDIKLAEKLKASFARALYSKGLTNEAKKLYGNIVPELVSAHAGESISLASGLFSCGMTDEAQKIIDSLNIEKDYSLPQLVSYRFFNHMRNLDFSAALEYMKDMAEKLDTDKDETFSRLALLFYLNGDISGAKKYLEKVEGEKNSQALATANGIRAFCLVVQDRENEAAEIFRENSAANTKQQMKDFDYALFLRMKGRNSEALEVVSKSLEHFRSRFNLCLVLVPLLKNENIGALINYYEKSGMAGFRKYLPWNWRFIWLDFCIALLYLRSGNRKRAEEIIPEMEKNSDPFTCAEKLLSGIFPRIPENSFEYRVMRGEAEFLQPANKE